MTQGDERCLLERENFNKQDCDIVWKIIIEYTGMSWKWWNWVG